MDSLAVLVTGYLMAILLGRLRIRSRWIRYILLIGIAAVQVSLVLMFLHDVEPPKLTRP
jgi:hypothetical protein